MPRESIAMTPREIAAFLAGQHWAIVASLDADGSPWAELTACALEDGELCFAVARGSRSHRNIERDDLGDRSDATVSIAGAQIAGISHQYADSVPGATMALIGSSGHLEIAVNGGNAAARLAANVGEEITIRL